MKITSLISTAGKGGYCRIPALDTEALTACLVNNKLDDGLMSKTLQMEGITHSSKDNPGVRAYAIQTLVEHRSVVEGLCSAVHNADATSASGTYYRGKIETPTDRHCARNMKKGRYAFVVEQIGYSNSRRTINVRISLANPRGCIGGTEIFARDNAIMFARIHLFIQDHMKKSGVRVEVLEGEGCEGVLKDAEEINAYYRQKDKVDEINAMREKCRHRRGEYCAEPLTESKIHLCPCRANGRCIAAEPPKRK